MKKKILVIVSHPDDEILGCGGTIAKYIQEGSKVYVAFTHEGSSSRFDNPNSIESRKAVILREKMALKSAKYLKYKIIEFGKNVNLKNNNYIFLYNIKKVSKIIKKIKPNIIFTHHPDDMNEDHYYTHKTVINACRPVLKKNLCDIYLMEIASSTDWSLNSNFKPNVFININKFFKKKIKALSYYTSELGKPPHSRSYKNLESLSRFRGGQVGIVFSEAFQLFRKIEY